MQIYSSYGSKVRKPLGEGEMGEGERKESKNEKNIKKVEKD